MLVRSLYAALLALLNNSGTRQHLIAVKQAWLNCIDYPGYAKYVRLRLQSKIDTIC